MRKLAIFCVAMIICACAPVTDSVVEINPTNPSNPTESVDATDMTVPTYASSQIREDLQTLAGMIVCVDAGHGIAEKNKRERVAPNSEETKAAFLGGTSGSTYTEEELNLIVAQKMEKKLCELGAVVHMARTDHTTDMGNIDRAEFAYEHNSDLWIRIHADGSENRDARGISVLIPSNACVEEGVRAASARAAKNVLDALIAQTRAKNRGLIKRDDLVGFNWTKVPVILIEMGFMSNAEEDELLSRGDYQEKIVQGVADGLEEYWKTKQ
ncbi:MAG: N-acetylmuramoyl-L-alanine amidase [Clostridia bacterium]|nr:N-acetylmuramoyl-L-alanine amidase [Clostridia bacterium]